MPSTGWSFRSPSHRRQSGCGPSGDSSTCRTFPRSSPSCSVIRTIDFGRPVLSSNVLHVPTGESLPANVLAKPSQKTIIHFIKKLFLKGSYAGGKCSRLGYDLELAHHFEHLISIRNLVLGQFAQTFEAECFHAKTR